MPRTPSEPIPAEIPQDQRAKFVALRAKRRALGQELTVEGFNSRRRWGINGESTRKRESRPPQTKEGVLAILRAKGLAP